MLQRSSLPMRNFLYPFENVQFIISENSLLKLSAFKEIKQFFSRRIELQNVVRHLRPPG